MPIDIKVVEEKDLDNKEGVYFVVKKDYCSEQAIGWDIERSVFAVLDYKERRTIFESDNLEEFVSRLKLFDSQFYAFTPDYLFNEDYSSDKKTDDVKIIRTVGLNSAEKDELVKIANKEYNAVISRQLCFNF